MKGAEVAPVVWKLTREKHKISAHKDNNDAGKVKQLAKKISAFLKQIVFHS